MTHPVLKLLPLRSSQFQIFKPDMIEDKIITWYTIKLHTTENMFKMSDLPKLLEQKVGKDILVKCRGMFF